MFLLRSVLRLLFCPSFVCLATMSCPFSGGAQKEASPGEAKPSNEQQTTQSIFFNPLI